MIGGREDDEEEEEGGWLLMISLLSLQASNSFTNFVAHDMLVTEKGEIVHSTSTYSKPLYIFYNIVELALYSLSFLGRMRAYFALGSESG